MTYFRGSLFASLEWAPLQMNFQKNPLQKFPDKDVKKMVNAVYMYFELNTKNRLIGGVL